MITEKYELVKNRIIEAINNEKVQKGLKVTSAVVGALVLLIVTAIYFMDVFDLEKTIRYNLFMAISLVAMYAAVIYLLRLLWGNKEFTYGRVYLVMVILLGIVMQIVLPPFSGPDESVHFLSAYNCSNIYMGKFVDYDHTMMRIEDTGFYNLDVNFPVCYEMLADGNWVGVSEENQQLIVWDVTWMYWYRYLASGLGITFARIFHLGMSGLIYAGRFFNLILMAALGWLCIKLTPYGKPQITCIAMVPLIMELNCSYSYDNCSILLSLLLGVLCLHYAEPDSRFRTVDLIIIGLVLLALLPNKSIYMALGIMIFMVPWKKWKKLVWDKEKGYVSNGINLAALVTVVTAGIYMAHRLYTYYPLVWKIRKELEKGAGSTIETITDMESYTLGYIIQNPLEPVKLMLKTWGLYGWTDIQYAFGQYPGHHTMTFVVPDILINGIIFSMLAALIVSRINWKDTVGKRKFIVWTIAMIVTLLAMYLGSLLRFTPIEGTDRIQVSYRYYIPIIMLGFVMTGSNKPENKATLACMYVQTLFYIGVCAWVLQLLITI